MLFFSSYLSLAIAALALLCRLTRTHSHSHSHEASQLLYNNNKSSASNSNSSSSRSRVKVAATTATVNNNKVSVALAPYQSAHTQIQSYTSNYVYVCVFVCTRKMNFNKMRINVEKHTKEISKQLGSVGRKTELKKRKNKKKKIRGYNINNAR